MNDVENLDIIELEDEEGETLRLCVERYFFYNGDEYVLLSDDCGQTDLEEVTRYVMKVQPVEDEDGEDMEEFVPVEDEDLMERLIQVAESTFTVNED